MPTVAPPDTLYHATFPDTAESILRSGVEPGADGVVHLIDSPDYAAGYVSIRNFTRIGDIAIVEMDGVPTPNIDIKRFDNATVLAINVHRLDLSLLLVPESPKLGEPTNYIYQGQIPREAVHIADVYYRGDARIPKQFAP